MVDVEDELSEDDPLSEPALERAATRYLARYESTAERLRRVLAERVARARLAGRTVDADRVRAAIDAVVARAVAAGHVNDERYARAKVEALRRRGESRRAIRWRLESRGVAAEVVAGVLADEAGPTDVDDGRGCGDAAEVAAARALLRRRRRGPFRVKPAVAGDRERDLAALARAGFSLDVARRALDDV
jgi:regulatory protein